MNTLMSTIKVIMTTIISILGYFLGGYDVMMVTLLIFMVVDYASGVINAVVKKKLCSSIGAKGIGKKIYILLLVGSVNLLGNAINIEELRYLVISFYLANEGISILENASKIGVPIPKKIKEVLIQLKEGEDT